MTKKTSSSKKDIAANSSPEDKALKLNDKFEFIEVGDSNVLISPSGLEFYAVNRPFWDFLTLFEYGAKQGYVMSSIRSFGGNKLFDDEYRELLLELKKHNALVESEKFINPRIDVDYCKVIPVLKIYDRQWILDNHPELLKSVQFSDTWSPAGNG